MIKAGSVIVAVCFCMLCVGLGWVAHVMGEMFADFGAELPALTQVALSPSLAQWGMMGIVVGFVVILKDFSPFAESIPNWMIGVVLFIFLALVALGLMIPMFQLGRGLSANSDASGKEITSLRELQWPKGGPAEACACLQRI